MVYAAMNHLTYSFCSSPLLDNFVYKLCYRWTVLLLISFSFTVTCRLLLGDSFMCITDNDHLPQSYMNVKCYADSAYTLPSKLIIQKDRISGMEPSSENFRRYQTYYSWVNLLFIVHAFNFYLLHLLWKSYESGYMHRLTAGVQKFFDKEEKRGLELCYLAKYVLVTQGKHKLYTLMYIFFEACNYVISFAQTLWLVHFFDITGVPDILPFSLEAWSDFRHFYFSPTGMCEIKTLKEGSRPIRIIAMCEMPMNSLFMKMFLFLHAWYIFVSVLTGITLLYRIALLVPTFRYFAAKTSASLAEQSVLKSLCLRMSYSDWFFLTRLQKTMIDIDFAQMLDKISIVSQGKDPKMDEDKSSSFEERMKDFESSGATSPL